MLKIYKILIFCALTCVCHLSTAAAQEVLIGVLAKNGAFDAMTKWETTAHYLSTRIGQEFAIVPLEFNEVFPALENEGVDFLLTNPSMFVIARKRYGASPVATMINFRQGKALTRFGGVIFAKAGDTNIKTLEDTKGHTLMGVKENSFGGWQMAYKELLDAGIDPRKAYPRISFAGSHADVVMAVLNGKVDVGTVRTDTLERMAAKRDISMEDFTIINPRKYAGFPFVCSTTLYPEWPLAKASGTSDELAAKVGEALKELKPSDAASLAAKIAGWTDPLDYGVVEEAQRALDAGAYPN